MLPENFQAFGYGPRICAGNMVARLQVALFLHHLSTGYKYDHIQYVSLHHLYIDFD